MEDTQKPKQIHELENEATAFESDDMIAVDGASNDTRRMSAASLVMITSQNALAGNLAPGFVKEKSYEAGKVVAYEGKTYKFRNPHRGPWNPSDVDPYTFSNEVASEVIPISNIDDLFDD